MTDLHALVVVPQGRVAHLQGLHGDGADASQVGLIALLLQDGLLSKLDAELFLQLTNDILKELQLVALLDDLRVDFNDCPLAALLFNLRLPASSENSLKARIALRRRPSW